MAQKWYQKAGVQAAIVGGIFLVLAAVVSVFVSVFWSRKESELQIAKVELQAKTASEYSEIATQRTALVSSLSSLADSYSNLLKYAQLTEEERKNCEESYENIKAELEKQKKLVEIVIARRSEAEVALENVKKNLSGRETDYIRAITDRDQYKKLYEQTKVELDRINLLLEDTKKRLLQMEAALEKLKKQNLNTEKSSSHGPDESLEKMSTTQNYTIKFKAFSFDPLKALPSIPNSYLIDEPVNGRPVYRIIQFKVELTVEQIIQLREQFKLKLYYYVPNCAYLEKMTNTKIDSLKRLKLFRWCGLYQPAYKIDSTIWGKTWDPNKFDPNFYLKAILFDHANLNLTANTFEQTGAKFHKTSDSTKDEWRKVIHFNISSLALLPKFAAIDEVERIEKETGFITTGGGPWILNK